MSEVDIWFLRLKIALKYSYNFFQEQNGTGNLKINMKSIRVLQKSSEDQFHPDGKRQEA